MIRRSFNNIQGATSGGSATPLVDSNSPTAGVSPAYAREDHVHPPVMWATGYISDTSDRTTTSTSFVTLGALNTLPVLYANTRVVVWFVGGCSNDSTNETNYFALYVDGVPVKYHAVTCRTANSPYGIAFAYRSPVLSVGSHTFQGFWRVSGGTGQIRSASFPEIEHLDSTFLFTVV